MTLETNEQILHQMNINLEHLEVSDCRLTQTLSVTSTTKPSCIKTVLDKIKIPKNTTLSKMF
jgi:Holliday junction resolvasome RuvABC ATP-dependent DNA helicase subunit